MKVQIESQSILAGKVNGDYILQQDLHNGATLILLADGMGGLSFPDRASKIVCEAIAEYFANADLFDCSKDIRKSIKYADNRLADYSKEKKCKMGVALLLVYINDSRLYYASLGDVRLYYRSKQGEVVQLTKDNIIVQGTDTYLTACITGRGFRNSIQVQELPLTLGDTLLLCSDGYYKGHDILHYFAWEKQTLSTSVDDDSSAVRIKVIE